MSRKAAPPAQTQGEGPVKDQPEDDEYTDYSEYSEEEWELSDEDEKKGFNEAEGPMSMEPSFPKVDPPPGATNWRWDAVHVNGLDFLKRQHMDEIFGQFNPVRVEWINDSNANVVFKDPPTARRALESLTYEVAQNKHWRRTPDILVAEHMPPIHLQMRFALESDEKKRKRARQKLTAADMEKLYGFGPAGPFDYWGPPPGPLSYWEENPDARAHFDAYGSKPPRGKVTLTPGGRHWGHDDRGGDDWGFAAGDEMRRQRRRQRTVERDWDAPYSRRGNGRRGRSYGGDGYGGGRRNRQRFETSERRSRTPKRSTFVTEEEKEKRKKRAERFKK